MISSVGDLLGRDIMQCQIILFLNEVEYKFSITDSSPSLEKKIYHVKEYDNVSIKIIYSKNIEFEPIIYLEDYQIALSKIDEKNFFSNKTLMFRESFGYSDLRFYLEGDGAIVEPFTLKFNVAVKKINALNIEKMLNYLCQHSENIINVCLSRTKLEFDNDSSKKSDPETILNTAEEFINQVLEVRLELHYHLRKRLVPIKIPKWQSTDKFINIEPYDILENIDKLIPTSTDGDVLINGRLYSIDAIDVSTLIPITDIEENNILIGACYSIRRVLKELIDMLNKGNDFSQTTFFDYEYESIDGLLLRVTKGGMLLRADLLISRTEELIKYFKNDLGIVYKGELKPKITPYVRSSRVYRVLFEKIHKWYDLGQPSTRGSDYLVKLKSVSKIYEIFTWFKIIEYFNEINLFKIYIKNLDYNDDNSISFLPRELDIESENLRINLKYEPKIEPFKLNETKHLDLVDMKHTYGYKNSFWLPDFVMKISSKFNNDAIYVILDAKYSRASSVKEYHLPRIYEKYFQYLSVFDGSIKIFDNSKVIAVLALYPEESSYRSISYFEKHGLESTIPRLPLVGGVGLSVDYQSIFERIMNNILRLSTLKLGEGS